MTAPVVVSVTVRIEATPEVVFSYFTDSALLVQWIGEWADLHPVKGGAFNLDVNTVPVRGRYLTVEPPNRVVFTWGIAGNDVLPADSTRVEVLLTADGDDTVVELVHRDLPAVQAGPHRAGWTAFLTRLGGVSIRRQPRYDSG